MKQHFYLFGQIQTGQTGGQLYNDTSLNAMVKADTFPYGEGGEG